MKDSRSPVKMTTGMSTAVLMVTWVETCIGLIFLEMRFLSSWKFTGRFRWDFGIAALTVVSASNNIIIDLKKATRWSWIGANLTRNYPDSGYSYRCPDLSPTVCQGGYGESRCGLVGSESSCRIGMGMVVSNDQRHGNYAAYVTNQSHVISHSTHQRGRKEPGRREDDLDWVELPDRWTSNNSKGHFMNDTDIIVTTEFATQFEDRELPEARSLSGSQTSAGGEEVRGAGTDTKNVI